MNTRFATVAFVILAFAAGTARANDDIVVESYVGTRPSDASTVLAPVYAELARRGVEQGNALATAVGRLSRDGGRLTGTQVVEAQRALDKAYQASIDGDYAAAAAGARAALDVYAKAPGQLARETPLRDQQFRALLIGARALEASGHGEDAFAVMAEAVRTFADRAPPAAEYDPQVIALYRRVKAELVRQGTGTLDVKVDDEAAIIFINERFVGTGSVHAEKLAAGHYRIYVAKGAVPGRIHEIDVPAGGAATVNVSWQLDAALETAPDHVGLIHANESDGSDLSTAIQLGHLLGAKRVVVLAFRPLNGSRAIVGYSIVVESQTRAFAALQVEPVAPSDEMLVKLAGFLSGDTNVSLVGLITKDDATNVDTASGRHGLGGRRVAALAVGGAGLLAVVGAGIVELSARGTYDDSKKATTQPEQDRLYDSANSKHIAAQGLAIGGAAAVVTGVALWVTGAHDAAERHGISLESVPTRGGAFVLVSGSF